jgi:hypothetical protein
LKLVSESGPSQHLANAKYEVDHRIRKLNHIYAN